jgi:hypothetical protein
MEPLHPLPLQPLVFEVWQLQISPPHNVFSSFSPTFSAPSAGIAILMNIKKAGPHIKHESLLIMILLLLSSINSVRKTICLLW